MPLLEIFIENITLIFVINYRGNDGNHPFVGGK